VCATSAEEALERIDRQRIDAMIADLNLPDRSGLELIAKVRSAGNHFPILVLTGAPSVSAAVEALKHGAADFLLKPIEAPRLRAILTELLHNDSSALPPVQAPVEALGDDFDRAPSLEGDWYEGMLGRSPAMKRVFDAIERVARTDAPVLIVGESGSGKELVARAIHARSHRRLGAFVPVHTGAIPKDLVASELFGHERGAFTGAATAAEGKFAAAGGGTIFLDEIATMVPDVQIVLLRVLETMRFSRVGGRKEHVADVRVVAATNRDLLTLVNERKFREDLYFRLAVFSVGLPPLRERTEDIPLLAEHYVQRFAQRYASMARGISPDALSMLVSHPWPGNVRELRNVIERAVVFATAREIGPRDLQLDGARLPDSRSSSAVPPPSNRSFLPPSGEWTPQPAPTAAAGSVVIPLGTSMQDVERTMIVQTLAFVGGNKQKAAQVLGISRRCIYNRLKQYGLHVPNREGEEEAPPETEGET